MARAATLCHLRSPDVGLWLLSDVIALASDVRFGGQRGPKRDADLAERDRRPAASKSSPIRSREVGLL
jgi:hypothetical protein